MPPLYISIGVDCGTANVLKALGLRTCSLPFDWVVSYEGVSRILENEFDDFVPPGPGIFHTGYAVRFHHNQFPRDADQVAKRVDRFRQLLTTTEDKVVFVRKGHCPHHHHEHKVVADEIQEAKRLDAVLRKRFPQLDYEIRVILLCHRCKTSEPLPPSLQSPHSIQVEDIAIPWPAGADLTNPPHFDACCRKLFGPANPQN